MQIILASQSPRRRELMQLFHLSFTVRAADIDETIDPGKAPADEVARLSLLKARAVPRVDGDIVIAADTIVVCDGQVLGKPKDPEEAAAMLRLLSGKVHQVMTGLTVLRGQTAVTRTQITQIRFCALTEKQIVAYVRSGEPMDKAGAYGIQGGGALFVEQIQGDYFNVVGLPVCLLGQILREIAPELSEETQ